MSKLDDILIRVKLAELAAMYKEMMCETVRIARIKNELTSEERNLFSIAFKHLIEDKRKALRVINNAIKQDEIEGSRFLTVDKMYRDIVETEMRNLVHLALATLEQHLIKPDGDIEARIFYLKLKGDYMRYLAEFEKGSDRDDAAECSLTAYKEAYELACCNLKPTHPLRLGVALNLAVFYYEIANSADRACKTAKQAFDDAIAELDNLSEESYKDSALVMQLLRDNLEMWITDMQKGDKDPRENVSQF